MKVTIIGTGNVATVLGRKMLEANIQIVEVYGRDEQKTAVLAHILNASAVLNIRDINQLSDIYLIAVSDDAIGNIALELPPVNGIIVHTAGSIPSQVLQTATNPERFGVIYPIQSLSSARSTLPAIPVAITGSNPQVVHCLKKFCLIWADNVSVIDDERRLYLHIAAILSTNFTNHLYTLAEQLCKQKELQFSSLRPLIEETALRLRDASPLDVQTGPARRGDTHTIERHLDLLSSNPGLQLIYQVMSDSIMNLNR